MDPNFWHQKWAVNSIAFHLNQSNPLLVKFINELCLAKGSRIFIPLCGKTLDAAWLLSEGYQVAAAELSELAIQQLFSELKLTPEVVELGKLKRYSAKDITIFAGNIFDLTKSDLGQVDAIYDRAALVALPEDMRQKYSAHLIQITGNAPQLLISFDYDQQLLEGPPFSVPSTELEKLYKHKYQLKCLIATDSDVRGTAVKETAWLLNP